MSSRVECRRHGDDKQEQYGSPGSCLIRAYRRGWGGVRCTASLRRPDALSLTRGWALGHEGTLRPGDPHPQGQDREPPRQRKLPRPETPSQGTSTTEGIPKTSNHTPSGGSPSSRPRLTSHWSRRQQPPLVPRCGCWRGSPRALGPAGARQTPKTGRHNNHPTTGTDHHRDGRRQRTTTGTTDKTDDHDRPRQKAKTTDTRPRRPPPPRLACLPHVLPHVVRPGSPGMRWDGARPRASAGPNKRLHLTPGSPVGVG